jgi:hypothetical protein
MDRAKVKAEESRKLGKEGKGINPLGYSVLITLRRGQCNGTAECRSGGTSK